MNNEVCCTPPVIEKSELGDVLASIQTLNVKLRTAVNKLDKVNQRVRGKAHLVKQDADKKTPSGIVEEINDVIAHSFGIAEELSGTSDDLSNL